MIDTFPISTVAAIRVKINIYVYHASEAYCFASDELKKQLSVSLKTEPLSRRNSRVAHLNTK